MRFTLRDLFWLTLVVGLVLGWWMDHWQLDLRRDAAEYQAESAREFAEGWQSQAEKAKGEVRVLRNALTENGIQH